MDDRVPQIEIEVLGDPDQAGQLSLRAFARASESLIELLNQIALDLGSQQKVGWVVRGLRTGSAIAEVEGIVVGESAPTTPEPNVSFPMVVLTETVNAFRIIENGGNLREFLSFAAIEKMRAFTSTVWDGTGGILLRTIGEEVSIDEEDARFVKALLERKTYSIGSIEGTIETISIHEKQPYFNVFHALDGHRIKCRSTSEVLSSGAVVLGARVRVSGEIQRRYDGRADAVEVESVSRFRSDEELPQVAAIRGIFRPESSGTM